MSSGAPTVTYLELRASNPDGSAAAGLSHTAGGLVLLHVQELAAAGEPRGAVTIVHDAGGHGGLCLDLGRGLAQAGWAVALPDLRGHGRSEGARGHSNGIQEIVRDLGDVQDHVAYRQPDAPKVLVGQGLGALWCLAYACERPDGVAGLVLVAPLCEPRFELPRPAGGLMKLFKKPGPDAPGRIGWSTPRDALSHDVITLRAGEQAAEAAARYLPAIGGLALPVLVLVGSEDAIAPAAKARSLAGPRVDVQVFDGLGHDLFHEPRGVEVASALVRWLDTQMSR